MGKMKKKQTGFVFCFVVLVCHKWQLAGKGKVQIEGFPR